MVVENHIVTHHEPLASLDALIAPETLSQLAGCRISSVRTAPFVGGHSASGSSFLAVNTNDGKGPRFVVKLTSPECDWIVRGTDDRIGREALVWTSGLLDRLPPELTHPVVGCARDGVGWAILMHDVSDSLLPDPIGDAPISAADHRHVLDALAALHATFWERLEYADPTLGLCQPKHRYTVLSAATAEREADHPNELIGWMREGWNLLGMMVDSDVADIVCRLADDPAPLCAALARFPQTIVHGDPRTANLGLVAGCPRRVVLIDWQLAGPGTPAVDLAWNLSAFDAKSPVTYETAIDWYREALEYRLGPRFDRNWWHPQLELSLLGQFVRYGWGYAWDAVHNPSAAIRQQSLRALRWWSERTRDGTRWL